MVMYVITHKENEMKLPKGYQNFLVGANKNKVKDSKNYLLDNIKENISSKNANYSELTGMFWLFKNAKDKNLGISHYHRYFTQDKSLLSKIKVFIRNKFNIMPLKELDLKLEAYDWIVPTKYKLIHGENVYHQYAKWHKEKDLITTKQVILDLYPQFVESFDEVMEQTSFLTFNMFYTTKREFDSYCKWLFDILFEVEKRTDITEYDDYQKRIYGFLSERLFNVWLNYYKDKKICYVDVIDSKKSGRRLILKHLLRGTY